MTERDAKQLAITLFFTKSPKKKWTEKDIQESGPREKRT